MGEDIYNALTGGGNTIPNSFYDAGQPGQFLPPVNENDETPPTTVAPGTSSAEPAPSTVNSTNTENVNDGGGNRDGGTGGVSSIPQRTMTAELPKVTTYQDLIEEMTPYRTLSPKEIQELKKKQKRDAIFAAIGDGIAAISNLYFAGKSGFSNFDGKDTLSEVGKKRWDKLWDDYTANQEKMLSWKMRAMGMDEAAAQAQWNREKSVEDSAIGDAVRERAYSDNRADRAEDVAYRDKVFNRQGEWHEDEVNRSEEHFDKTYKLQSRHSAGGSTPKGTTVTYGNGTTADGKPMNITMPAADWLANAQTLFSLLPKDIRDGVHGAPIMEKDGITGSTNFTGKYEKPDANQKLEAVLDFLGDGMNYTENGQRNRTYYNNLVDRLRSVAGLPADHSHYLP